MASGSRGRVCVVWLRAREGERLQCINYKMCQTPYSHVYSPVSIRLSVCVSCALWPVPVGIGYALELGKIHSHPIDGRSMHPPTHTCDGLARPSSRAHHRRTHDLSCSPRWSLLPRQRCCTSRSRPPSPRRQPSRGGRLCWAAQQLSCRQRRALPRRLARQTTCPASWSVPRRARCARLRC